MSRLTGRPPERAVESAPARGDRLWASGGSGTFARMTTRRLIALAALAAGIVLIVIAIIWFALPAKSLPGFMGHIDGATVHRTKRGAAALVVGLVALAFAAYELRPARQSPA